MAGVRLAGVGRAAGVSGDWDKRYDHSAVLILALDTTTRAGSVAVARNDDILAVVEGDGARTHGERMPGEIEAALIAAGVHASDLQLLVVASGPGAFTGLRIGLAAIQGLAMVLGVPVVGVSALDALAATASSSLESHETLVFAWMDAARGEVFGADYDRSHGPRDRSNSDPSFVWRSTAGPVVAAPATILSALDAARVRSMVFVGDGAVRYAFEIGAWSRGLSRVLDTPPALAPALVRVGRRLAATGAAGPPHALQPLYVRRPDAELERLRRS